MVWHRPLFLQPASGSYTYSGAELRALITILSPVDGVKWKNDLKVTQRAAGANPSVDVAAGSFTVTGSSVAGQGTYGGWSDAVTNVAVTTAPVSGTRTDAIVAQIYDDQEDSSGQGAGTAIAVTNPLLNTGTPPATPANALLLAVVTVASGTAAITNAMIKDARSLNTLGDIPMWEMTGGNGAAVANSLATTYVGTFSELIGMDTNANPGEMVVRQPGRYTTSFTTRMDTGGTTGAQRQAFVELVRAGTVIRRVGSHEIFPSAVESTGGIAQTASGQVRCQAGDVLRARAYQLSGGTLHLADFNNELSFTGFRVGP